MKDDQEVLLVRDQKSALEAINLVEASLSDMVGYDSQKTYSPKEREPYDALSDRFMRAVEISIRYFRSYERYNYGESSDTLRDLLNRMEKLGLISSVMLWIQMREVRNRIVHDYLPEEIKQMYDSIMGEMGTELLRLKNSHLAGE